MVEVPEDGHPERAVWIDAALKAEADRIVAELKFEIQQGVVAILHAMGAAKGSTPAMEQLRGYLKDRALWLPE